ncbi:MAG: hypothetical protein IPM69_11525 [Ignavibacteria bacterium]|nr:hypothetical protein [Ignavibacteria bacterium]
MIFIVMMTHSAFAADPVVKLPPMPSKSEMEVYEESEELFAKLLLNYYQIASTLEAQLKNWDIKPTVNVPTPTLDELTSQESKTIKKYFTIGFKLQLQIESLSEEQVHAHLTDIQKRLINERKRNAELGISKYELELASKNTEVYKNRLNEVLTMSDSLKLANDSITYQYYMLKYSSGDAYSRAIINSSSPTLMLSNQACLLAFNTDVLQTDVSFGAKAELNLNSIAEYDKYFDLWFAYLMPQVKSIHNNTTASITRDWNSNIYSFGLNLNLPEVIELKPVKAGIKLGVGHYWGSGTSPNVSLPEIDYKGQLMNVELNFSRFTTLSPMSLYFNFGVLFPSREMIYADPVQVQNILKNNITTFALGLRFTIL